MEQADNLISRNFIRDIICLQRYRWVIYSFPRRDVSKVIKRGGIAINCNCLDTYDIFELPVLAIEHICNPASSSSKSDRKYPHVTLLILNDFSISLGGVVPGTR